jgi:hypothetical protein
VLKGGSSSGSIGSCGVVVQQIIATFSVKLPYSIVLKGVDGGQNHTLAHRWPHAHAHCKECKKSSWLRNNYILQSLLNLNIHEVVDVLRLASESYDLVAWRTLEKFRIEVSWLLRATSNSSISFATSECANVSHSEGPEAVGAPRCISHGVDTCGLSFCSHLQTPSECIGQPKLLAFVKKVLDVCARRWWAHERDHKEHCPGLRRTFQVCRVGIKNESLHWSADHEGRVWGFEMKVAENPSLTKLISYSLWHEVTRAADGSKCLFGVDTSSQAQWPSLNRSRSMPEHVSSRSVNVHDVRLQHQRPIVILLQRFNPFHSV